jgi:hypothetical protein
VPAVEPSGKLAQFHDVEIVAVQKYVVSAFRRTRSG